MHGTAIQVTGKGCDGNFQVTEVVTQTFRSNVLCVAEARHRYLDGCQIASNFLGWQLVCDGINRDSYPINQ